MEALHLSIITGTGIAAIVIFALFITGQKQVILEGINQEYTAGEPVQATMKFSDNDPACHDPRIVVLNTTNKSQIIYDIHPHYDACNSFFSTGFYAGIDNDSIVNKTQTYTIMGYLGDKSVEKQFVVKPDPNRTKLYTLLQIDDLKQTYQPNEPIDFTIWIRGYGIFNAGLEPVVALEDSTGQQVWSVDRNGLLMCCPAELFELNRNVTAVQIGGPPVINKAGLYKLVAMYEKTTVEKEFTVSNSAPQITLYSHHDTVPVMIDRNYTGFSLNYAITDGPYNKILGAQIDEKNHYLSLMLDVTRSGTLSISVPRALLDSQMHNQDVPFVILNDGHEVLYNETASITERDLTIPFKAGVNIMEILVPQLI